ncbi:pilus assembly protein [Herbaspirillum sp. HC18]|nr:pilus assembly protein [Herbaspirillum sp. HC18]
MKRTSILLQAGALLALAGCAPLMPELDKRFGESVRVINAQQTLSPEASSNTGLVSLDGQAAHHAIVRYSKSYEAPTPQPNVFSIGVSSAGSK